MVEGVEHHRIGLVAGLGDGLFLGLADLDPQALGAREVGQRDIGVFGIGQACAKRQRAVALAHVIELVCIEGQGHQAHHHAFVRLAGMARLVAQALNAHRSEEHTSELQSHRDLHSFPTRRSSDLRRLAPVKSVSETSGSSGSDRPAPNASVPSPLHMSLSWCALRARATRRTIMRSSVSLGWRAWWPRPSMHTDRKSTRLNSSHTEIYTLSLHDALPISGAWRP